MGYDKGKLSKEQILKAASAVVLEKGFAATSIADLSQAAHTSAGKLTHHFPTKADLFEAISGKMMLGFEAGPLALLGDQSLPPERRIENFFDAVYQFYSFQTGIIGCPLGHAAGGGEGVSPFMQQEALALLRKSETLFMQAFLDLLDSPNLARTKATIFVSSWQGAVVVSRAGKGIGYIREVFSSLNAIALLQPGIPLLQSGVSPLEY